MNPQIMSKLQAKLDADKAAYFAAGGKITVHETTPPKPKDEWIDTLSAALIIGVCRRTLRHMLSETSRQGSPCAVTLMVNRKRLWLLSSVEALRDKRRAA